MPCMFDLLWNKGVLIVLFVPVAYYLSTTVIQINLAFSTQRKHWLFSMHCLLHHGCTVCVKAQVRSVGQLQPPMCECYTDRGHLSLSSGGIGRMEESEVTVKGWSGIQKGMWHLCLLDGKEFSLAISSRSALFLPEEERAMLINLGRKEFACYEPF